MNTPQGTPVKAAVERDADAPMERAPLFVIQHTTFPTQYLGRLRIDDELDWVPFTWAYTYRVEEEARAAAEAARVLPDSTIVDVYAVNDAARF